ncbi:MAG: hypothetical protein OFPII_28470 [Osedax symbiont Rs1]|nr:MAG: hypothetical protein OFPII_28470 [Osedax symbiont Rs1]
MSRSKKKRTGLMTILDRPPSKKEFLEDPDSKESRKKKALAEKKKPQSVYEKGRSEKKSQAQKDAEAAAHAAANKGRLADKIKAAHAKK